MKNLNKFENFDIKEKFRFLKKIPKIYYFVSNIKKIMDLIYICLISPLLTLEILVFIFKYKKNIFKNKKISVFFHWSFGHQILAMEYASRLNINDRITFIEFIFPRNNPYLSKCYNNIDSIEFKSLVIKNKYKIHGDFQKYIFKYLIKLIFSKKNIILFDPITYYTDKSNNNNLRYYNSSTKKIEKYFTNSINFPQLLSDRKYIKPKLPKNLTDEIKKQILNYYPNFFDKNFICILLRTRRSLEHYDNSRDSGDQKNYIKSINKFISLGFNVVGSGETNDNIFDGIDGYFSFENLKINRYLLNLFFLLNCKKLICQHSGPMILTNSVDTQNIIINSFPFYNGSYSKKDKILFVKVKYKNKIISIEEIFNNSNHRDLIYGKYEMMGDYQLKSCNENEIYNGIFNENYYNLNYPKDTLIYHTNNKLICKHDEND